VDREVARCLRLPVHIPEETLTDLVIRPLSAGETSLFESLPDPGLVGFAAFGDTYQAMADAGEYRPEWTWVALRGDRVVARAAWWGGPADEQPKTLDWLDFTDPDAAVELLRTAPLRSEYFIGLPPRWREKPDVRAAAEARLAVAARVGLRPYVERLRYTWTPSCGLPARPARLEYRAEPDDDVILDVLRRAQPGTLNLRTGREVERHGPDAAALDELEFLRWLPGPRDWWRVAYKPGGELVGLTVPSRNYADPVVGIIVVVPEQRGNGYGYDLLVECTHRLVAAGAERIVASADAGNVPMAAAFARAGYPITQQRIFLD
jgi:RimJ/RimL family protein N-acetyltransferase